MYPDQNPGEIIPARSAHLNYKSIREQAADFGDKVALKQVWQNLIPNAVKYSSLEDAPIIEIKSVNEGNEIAYKVSDNGIGFDMRRLFSFHVIKGPLKNNQQSSAAPRRHQLQDNRQCI